MVVQLLSKKLLLKNCLWFAHVYYCGSVTMVTDHLDMNMADLDTLMYMMINKNNCAEVNKTGHLITKLCAVSV